MMQSTYEYAALDSTKHQIRLLHLQPRHDSRTKETNHEEAAEDIRCTFTLASLQDNVGYEALSYVWGTTEAAASILVHGSRFLVTNHLKSILEHLRYEDRERVLWIDALCIDQSDVSERSQQVSEMHEIYSSASQVIAYLSEAWDSIDSTIKVIEFVAAHPDIHWTSSDSGIKSCGFDVESPTQNASIVQVFASPWWSRLWTVQEFMLAQRVVFMCGAYQLDADYLVLFTRYCLAHDANCCQILTKIHSTSSNVHAFMEVFFRFMRLQHTKDVSKTAPPGFLRLLSLFRSRQCSNPCDKVYGLLGMTTAEFRSSISVDYNRSPDDLYTDVTVAASQRGLQFLSWHYGVRNKSLDLPSWILDFSTPLTEFANMCYMNRATATQDLFSASRNSRANFAYTGSGKAIAHTVLFDTVRYTMRNPTSASISADIQRRKDIIDECWDKVKACESSSNIYPCKRDAFWRTVCGGVGAVAKETDSGRYRAVVDDDVKIFLMWNHLIRTDDYRKDGRLVGTLQMLRFDSAFNHVTIGRTFAITDRGHIGWVPEKTRERDSVVLFSGGKVPYVLREVDGSNTSHSSTKSGDGTRHFKFLGDAYIQGIMHGEAYDEQRLETVTLI